MEANRKRRGFIKGKLMPFYHSSKAPFNVQYSSKVVKPSQSSPSAASVGYVPHHHQDLVISPAAMQKVSFIVPAAAETNRDKLTQLDKLFGVAGDESVDIKAASYISSVQERFKLAQLGTKEEEDMEQRNVI